MASVRDAFHKIGPLLPRTLDQALSWLGKRVRRRIGFEHTLVRTNDWSGGLVSVVIKRRGVKLPEQAFLPGKEYGPKASRKQRD